MVDIYNRSRDYSRVRAQFEEWPISEENRSHIRRYLRNAIDRRSPGRRYSDLCLLKRIFIGTTRGKQTVRPLITVPLSSLTLRDFEVMRERCEGEFTSKDMFDKLTNHVRNLFEDAFGEHQEKRSLIDILFRTGRRRFFQWRSDNPVNETIDQSKYYTFDDFKRLLRVAQRPKDKALLAVAWEGTPRPNEYLTLTIGDVDELPDGFRIRAHISKRKGKALHRYLYLFTFQAEFNELWRCHPFRDDPQAPLFYREDNGRFGAPLSGAGANKIVKKLDRLSGVRKNGTLYFLRHGGYTWKRLQGMNPALAGKDMGWAPGGKEERRYLHLTEEEVMNERQRLATGASTPTRPVRIEPRTCHACRTVNSPVEDRCLGCGMALDIRSVVREYREAKAMEVAMFDQRIGRFATRKDFRVRGLSRNPRENPEPRLDAG